jgi:hypothetical protein
MPGRNSACLLIPHRIDTAPLPWHVRGMFCRFGPVLLALSEAWEVSSPLSSSAAESICCRNHSPTSPCSSCRVNCRGVYHRPGHHPDLFYLYPQEIAEPRGSPHAGVRAVAHTSTLARSDAHLTAGAGERECQKPEKHRRNRELNGADQLCARNRREIAFFQYALVMQFVPGDHECQRPNADFFSAGRAATHPGRLT